MGLYLGVEIVSGGPDAPDPEGAREICDALLDEGVIVQPTGDHKNVLKIKPPLTLDWLAVDAVPCGTRPRAHHGGCAEPTLASGRLAAAVRRASVDDVEDVLLNAVAVHLGLDERELACVHVAVAEEPLAGAEEQREDEQVVAVDEAGVGEAVGELRRCRGR